MLKTKKTTQEPELLLDRMDKQIAELMEKNELKIVDPHRADCNYILDTSKGYVYVYYEQPISGTPPAHWCKCTECVGRWYRQQVVLANDVTMYRSGIVYGYIDGSGSPEQAARAIINVIESGRQLNRLTCGNNISSYSTTP